MTDKEMTIEQALELVLNLTNRTIKGWDGVRESGLSQSIRDLKQAAVVLHQIGEPVERSKIVNIDVCRVCGHVYHDEQQKGYCDQCDGDGKTRYTCEYKPMTKRWTETSALKCVIETSEPTYEPVESEE